MRFFWATTLFGGVIGTLTILFTMLFSNSAPQQAAGYAMACAVTVVPYVFTRAAQELFGLSRDESTSRIIEAIKRHDPSTLPPKTNAAPK